MPSTTSQTAPVSGGFLNSPRAQRRFMLISALVLTVGVVAFIAAYVLRGTGNRYTDTISNQNAQLSHPEKAVPISKTELQVARKFIETAVLRKDLPAAYRIAHVDLKGRMSLKQWDTGNIPVIGYPAANAKTAAFQVDFSYQTSALLEVDLVAKRGSPSSVRPHLLFFLGLKRDHGRKDGRWLVNYWEPHWKPPIPEALH
jgi:hypothetical protein